MVLRTVIYYGNKIFEIDLSKPLDLSIALQNGTNNVNAWDLDPPKIAPHVEGEFIGKVSEGAAVNFNDIWLNPHAHGTHTECVGHISEAFYSVNQSLNCFFFLAELVTIAPEKYQEDFVVSRKQLQYALRDKSPQALIIRTLPNTRQKLNKDYSNTNPPYLLEQAAQFLAEKEVEHLLIDLPSVDREKDAGALLAHKAFWNFEGEVRNGATITEFIFVDNSIPDGSYILNLQMAPFENDASPSRPVLYTIMES